MKRLAFLLLPLAACADFPRDTAGTLERVRGGALRVGWAADDPALRRFVRRLAARNGSRPQSFAGPAEPLLLMLEKGELDLVVGRFDAHTPWSTRVTFSTPIATTPDGHEEAKAAARTGEHAWAMELDRTVAAGQ